MANILESADERTEDNEEIINTLNSIADKAKGGTGEVPVPTPTAAPSDDKSAASDGNKAKFEYIRISDYEKATFEKAKEENPGDSIVLIHDGVRPFIGYDVISKNIASVKEHGSAITSNLC